MNRSNNKIIIDKDWYYTVSRIKNRIIFSPCEKLKKAQRYFLNAVKWTYPLSADTLKTAQKHTGKKWILKMDIKDFYASVPPVYVNFVIKRVCKNIQLADINQYLKMTTLNGTLPVGAATSPHIANACFTPIDKEIRNFCAILNVNYSRYADDLTFSANDKILLNMVEKRVTQMLMWYGFNPNPKKTKYICENKQQNILGLVVNNGSVRIPKAQQRRVRAMLHNYAIFKSYHNLNRYVDENKLAGHIAYIKHVDKKRYNQLKIYAKKLEEKHYIEFPFFK